MKIAIIKYNAGNIRSVICALERLGIEPVLTDDKETLLSADKVIFSGVGEAGSAMEYLKSKELDKLIVQIKQPFLGICLGLQLMCSYSEESNTTCLGIFDTPVKKFNSQNQNRLKVPHMGWNNLQNLKTSLFKNIPENTYVYFVHSYYAELSNETSALCNYILDFSASLQKNNFYGVQFHPEKSGDIGNQIIKNFIEL